MCAKEMGGTSIIFITPVAERTLLVLFCTITKTAKYKSKWYLFALMIDSQGKVIGATMYCFPY